MPPGIVAPGPGVDATSSSAPGILCKCALLHFFWFFVQIFYVSSFICCSVSLFVGILSSQLACNGESSSLNGEWQGEGSLGVGYFRQKQQITCQTIPDVGSVNSPGGSGAGTSLRIRLC